MKVISAKNKSFDKLLDKLLSKRKNKLRSDYISVKNIIKDVRKNGDKALVKYEKKFNKNKTIIPNLKKIKDSIGWEAKQSIFDVIDKMFFYKNF